MSTPNQAVTQILNQHAAIPWCFNTHDANAGNWADRNEVRPGCFYLTPRYFYSVAVSENHGCKTKARAGRKAGTHGGNLGSVTKLGAHHSSLQKRGPITFP